MDTRKDVAGPGCLLTWGLMRPDECWPPWWPARMREETSVSAVMHKPGRELDDPKELLLGFLDYYRSVIIRKFDGVTYA